MQVFNMHSQLPASSTTVIKGDETWLLHYVQFVCLSRALICVFYVSDVSFTSLVCFGCCCLCSWLPGKTCLWNDQLCVEWDVKPYLLSISCTNLHTVLSLMAEIRRSDRRWVGWGWEGNWGSCKHVRECTHLWWWSAVLSSRSVSDI